MSERTLRLAARDFAGAIEDFDAVIRLKPDYAEAYDGRGNARMATGQYAAAISDFDKALELNAGPRPRPTRAAPRRIITRRSTMRHGPTRRRARNSAGELDADFVRALSRDSGRSR